MISIIIPLYNKAAQIEATLRGVFRQTFADFEVIIVNDGSTDNSAEIAGSIKDNRIRIINQENAGVSAARNRGRAEAKGEFVAFLDADDQWDKDYLAVQHQLTLDYPQCDVFATNYSFKDAKGNVSPTILRKMPFDTPAGILCNYFEVASCSHPPLWTSAVMVRRSAIQAVGGFPVGVKSGEDLLTWARLAYKHQIAYFNKPMAAFIFDPENFNEDQKKRVPETIDIVGTELNALLKQKNSPPYLRQYVALWHKMRCRIFLQKGFRKNALIESVKSASLSLNIRILIFMVLCVTPKFIITKLFKTLG